MNARKSVQELLDFIDASPSPWHAVTSIKTHLEIWKFQELSETQIWNLQPNQRYYVVRDDSSIIIFVTGKQAVAETGYKIIGAHTDSPGLRLKPKAAFGTDGLIRLGVEMYGGAILATFTDRDLSLAGQVNYQTPTGKLITQQLKFPQALLRLPNLAIHMNRHVNEQGLKLDKQTELPLILATLKSQLPKDYLHNLIAQALAINPEQILSWEFNVYDTQAGTFWGAEQEFYANSQLDNLASCHAAIMALLNESVLDNEATLVCALFDHEEVGSETAKGADGNFLTAILQRIADSYDTATEAYQRALANSFMLSVDMAHAYQPNFPYAYETQHKVYMNQGPVIKINANQRYASASVGTAKFMQWCQQASVPYQQYSHHSNIACGSTIGPMSAAKLGVKTVDIGSPMWAMHSIRESAGVLDHYYLIKVLKQFLNSP